MKLRIAFLASDKPRERLLADAFLMGAKKHGHSVDTLPLLPAGERWEAETKARLGTYDVACMVGVKSRELYRLHFQAHVPIIYLDKGYDRGKASDGRPGWEYWRVSVNNHHPTARLAALKMPGDRLEAIGWLERRKPWKGGGRDILIAGSSAKYHAFYGMKEPTLYTRGLIRDIRETGDRRPIVYRPKPSWRDAVAIDDTRFSRPPETIYDVLHHAAVHVTHGSNSCFEAVLMGVPSVVLGEAVAKPISSTSLLDLRAPRLASDVEITQWLANLAYCQWTSAEFASGRAWDHIGEELHA